MLFEKIKLEENEQILMILRRHWFVFLLRVISITFVAVIPFLILMVARMFEVSATIVGTALTNYSDQIWFFGALWLLIHWMSLAYAWTDQYLDLWVVTDRRIISIDQRSLFIRSVGSFRLERLQDMNIIIPGFLATLFNYGNIDAQTASGDTFRGRALPQPRELKALILEAADNRMRKSTSMVAAETKPNTGL